MLEPLRVGSQVLAGTILGRLRRTAGSRRPHLVFELRPAGVAEAPIDPRPFLDAWSQLETLELHRDSFNSPFYGPNLHADERRRNAADEPDRTSNAPCSRTRM